MRRKCYICLAFLLTVVPAYSTDSLSEAILSNDLVFSEDIPEALARSTPLMILTQTVTHAEKPLFGKDLEGAIVKEKLNRAGIEATLYEGDFKREFKTTQALPLLLSPKCIVESYIERNATHTYNLSLSIFLIEYTAQDKSSRTFIARVTWSKEIRLRDLRAKDLVERMSQSIRKEIDGLIRKPHLNLQVSHSPVGTEYRQARVSFRTKTPPTSTMPHAPKLGQSYFQMGITAGTPAWGNILVGVWDLETVPLVAGLSGMYYGTKYRGIQFDLGWGLNRGSLRHAVGMSLVGFNETSEISSLVTDPTTRSPNVEKTTVDRLRVYVGPTYTVNWSGFRFQGGVAYRPGEGSDTNVRWLIQVGYTPLIRF